MHFTLTPPECHMEIRSGYGTSGARVAGPVHVGDPLTLLVNMRSQFGEWGEDSNSSSNNNSSSSSSSSSNSSSSNSSSSSSNNFKLKIMPNLCFFFPDGFDIIVNDCYAHNGANKRIQLIDHHGCPVDDKLISRQEVQTIRDREIEQHSLSHIVYEVQSNLGMIPDIPHQGVRTLMWHIRGVRTLMWHIRGVRTLMWDIRGSGP